LNVLDSSDSSDSLDKEIVYFGEQRARKDVSVLVGREYLIDFLNSDNQIQKINKCIDRDCSDLIRLIIDEYQMDQILLNYEISSSDSIFLFFYTSMNKIMNNSENIKILPYEASTQDLTFIGACSLKLTSQN
jgi:uncharacterized protein (DUF952 family)